MKLGEKMVNSKLLLDNAELTHNVTLDLHEKIIESKNKAMFYSYSKLLYSFIIYCIFSYALKLNH